MRIRRLSEPLANFVSFFLQTKGPLAEAPTLVRRKKTRKVGPNERGHEAKSNEDEVALGQKKKDGRNDGFDANCKTKVNKDDVEVADDAETRLGAGHLDGRPDRDPCKP